MLAWEKGHGPQFHKGTRALLFFSLLHTLIVLHSLMCIRHISEIKGDRFDHRNLLMSWMWLSVFLTSVCVCFRIPSRGAGTWSFWSVRVMTALSSLSRATSGGSSCRRTRGRATAGPHSRGRCSTPWGRKPPLGSYPFLKTKNLYIYHFSPSDFSVFLCTYVYLFFVCVFFLIFFFTLLVLLYYRSRTIERCALAAICQDQPQ